MDTKQLYAWIQLASKQPASTKRCLCTFLKATDCTLISLARTTKLKLKITHKIYCTKFHLNQVSCRLFLVLQPSNWSPPKQVIAECGTSINSELSSPGNVLPTNGWAKLCFITWRKCKHWKKHSEPTSSRSNSQKGPERKQVYIRLWCTRTHCLESPLHWLSPLTQAHIASYLWSILILYTLQLQFLT